MSMRSVAALVTLLWVGAPASAEANPLCRWLGLCTYLSPGFELTVVDTETGTPLADVYAWAEWVQYGAHGRGGPLMVQTAISTADGRLTFSWWGPATGSPGGLVLGIDPAVILFKPGYATLLVHNETAPGASHHAMIRGLSRQNQTARLQPFRGTPAEWVEHLRKLVFPALAAFVSDASRNRFRTLYLGRLEIAAGALAGVPPATPGAHALKVGIEQSTRFFGGAPR
jgi:hypothetical protein